MESQYLLYIGSGLSAGSLFLGAIVGIILATKERYRGFRYGAFFLGASLAVVPLQGVSVSCYCFQFLDDGLAFVTAIPIGLGVVGIVTAYFFLPFRSKSLFIVVSVPYLFTLYLSPVFIFNLIYILKLYKPVETPDTQIG